jgi:hypothetical protein
MAINATPVSFNISGQKAGTGMISGIRVATPDIILQDESIPLEVISGLIFENIGGQELISISRNDLISNNVTKNSIISNIDYVNGIYSPKNLFNLPGGINSYFGNFQKNLNQYVPENGTSASGDKIYIDTNGDLVFDVKNLNATDVVEVQLLTQGSVENDIMNVTEAGS